MSKPRMNSKNTHGTSCTLAAAITGYMAQGLSDINACIKAKEYILMLFYTVEIVTW